MLERLLKPYIDKGLCIKQRSYWPFKHFYIFRQRTLYYKDLESVTVSLTKVGKKNILSFGELGTVYYMFVNDLNIVVVDDIIIKPVFINFQDILIDELLGTIFTKKRVTQMKYSLK